MTPVLGIGVGASSVGALVIDGAKGVTWAATTTYEALEELPELLATLIAEVPGRVCRTRIVLERSLVQLRAVPVAALKARDARRYVALQAARLFRHNGTALITDACVLARGDDGPVLWAAAVEEAIPTTLVAACEQNGLHLQSLSLSADVLPCTVARRPEDGDIAFPVEGGYEVLTIQAGRVVRSRVRRGSEWEPPVFAMPLAALGERAPTLATAYAAATTRPRLSLLPPNTEAARVRATRKRLGVLAGVGLLLWFLAGAIHVGRMVMMAHAADRELTALAPALDSALALRRELTLMEEALRAMDRIDQDRSRVLELLAGVTEALSDSVFLTSFTITTDSTVRVSGFAARAGDAVTSLGRVPGLADVRLEGAVRQEPLPHDPTQRWERFTARGRVGSSS
jgi:hypothetical protein